MKKKLAQLKKLFKKASEQHQVHARRVTFKMLQEAGYEQGWFSIQQLGGLAAIKNNLFPLEPSLVRRKIKDDSAKYNKQLMKFEREMLNFKYFDSVLTKSLGKLKVRPHKVQKASTKGKSLTFELMISDVHYGKVGDNFNTTVARKRLERVADVTLNAIKREQKHYNVDRIILFLGGDLIENDTLHKPDSFYSCNIPTAVQIAEVTEVLHNSILEPLKTLKLPIDVICIAGNHERFQDYQITKQGKSYLSYPIYYGLKLLNKGVNFNIIEDVYHIEDIYGMKVLYEHGHYFKGAFESRNIESHILRRTETSGIKIDQLRIGHIHEYRCFRRGRAISNECLCGHDAYSKAHGFNVGVGQVLNSYVNTKNRKSKFFQSLAIDLSEVK